jgi:glycerol uptake facilitator-like aquaporin
VDASPSRRPVVEAWGTGLLILFGPGSVVAALAVGDGVLDYAGLGMIALSFGQDTEPSRATPGAAGRRNKAERPR